MISSLAFYPFGFPRKQFDLLQSVDPFGFTQKEFDAETRLNEFGTRYFSPAVARFISADPKLAATPEAARPPSDLHLYAYARSSPVSLLDADGKEPVKSQATTLEDFMIQLRQMEGNKSYSETLAALTAYPFGGVPAKNSTSKFRYIYTEKAGWIDVTHTLGVAYKMQETLRPQLGSRRLDSAIGHSILSYLAHEYSGVYLAARFSLWRHTVKIEEGQAKNAKQSRWSYEDPSSNLQGLHLYLKSGEHLRFSDQFERFMKNLGATKPELAPNWESMPQVETPNKPPSMINKSFKPLFTKDE